MKVQVSIFIEIPDAVGPLSTEDLYGLSDVVQGTKDVLNNSNLSWKPYGEEVRITILDEETK